MTRYLAKDDLLLGSLEQTIISQVTPDTVSACAGKIEFLIKGQNLWRNARAYLRGRRHSTLDVLPDMKGIVVSFDMQSLPGVPIPNAREDLVVWTSFGSDKRKIRIIDRLNGEPCQQGHSASAVFPSTDLTRYVDKPAAHSDVRVHLAAPLPPAVRDIQVSAKLLDEHGKLLLESEKAPNAVHPGKYYESDVPVEPPEGIAESALAGTSLFPPIRWKWVPGSASLPTIRHFPV